MTPEELYRHDVNGWLLVEDVIDPALLRRLNARADAWKQAGLRQLASSGRRIDSLAEHVEDQLPSMRGDAVGPDVGYSRGDMRIDNLINHEELLIELVDNPRLLPYIRELVERPRLKSTWLTFRWRHGTTGGHGNHTPSTTVNHSHFNGGIRHNLLNVMFALEDIAVGRGGLQLISGSHKANYPIPPGMDVADMRVEIPMPAGSALLFSHEVHHASYNPSDVERRIIMFTYCPGAIANSFVGDTLYDRQFAVAPEGSWLKYLLRRPLGNGESYPQPQEAAQQQEALAAARQANAQ